MKKDGERFKKSFCYRIFIAEFGLLGCGLSLEVGHIFGTLIGDEEPVYDLSFMEDHQLILGTIGTIGVVELKVLRMRLLAGIEEKAHRGEMLRLLPAGYNRARRLRIWIDGFRKHLTWFKNLAGCGVFFRHFYILHCNTTVSITEKTAKTKGDTALKNRFFKIQQKMNSGKSIPLVFADK